jgi:hypothetical protein
MSISGKIKQTVDAILAEREAHEANPDAPAPVSTAVENGSREAIFAGRESQAWKDYMGRFADSKGELERLVPPPEAPDPNVDREKARAYLVCNGMCGMTTGENLGDNVDKTLDL